MFRQKTTHTHIWQHNSMTTEATTPCWEECRMKFTKTYQGLPIFSFLKVNQSTHEDKRRKKESITTKNQTVDPLQIPVRIHLVSIKNVVCRHLFERVEWCTCPHVSPTAVPQINSFYWCAVCFFVCMNVLFLNIHTPAKRSFLFSIIWNNFWMPCGNWRWFALWVMRTVLRSTKWWNFTAFRFDEEILCWFLKYEYCFVVCVIRALPHRR